jgi:hypothetical protein
MDNTDIGQELMFCPSSVAALDSMTALVLKRYTDICQFNIIHYVSMHLHHPYGSLNNLQC